MATGSGQGASPSSTGLGVSDLGVLCEVLHPVRSKYKHLGLQIGVDITTIQNIEADHSKAEDHRALTWADIVKALRSRTVAEHQLANNIQTSYGMRFSPTIADQPRIKTHQKSESKRKTRKIASPLPHEAEQEQELGKEVRDNLKSKMSRKYTRKIDINDKPISINSNEEEIDRRENKGTKSYIQSESKYNSPQDHQKVSGKKHKNISRQRIPKYYEQIESKGEQERNVVNSDSTEESYSSEQEEDSAEEVSETERYQKPSEQPREDEYPHSHRETPVRKTKGERISSTLEKNKSESQSKPEGKTKRQKKAIDQSVNKALQHKMAYDAHGMCERDAREHKQKKSEKHSKKGLQKEPRENKSESSEMRGGEERVSSPYNRGKSKKPKSMKGTHQQKRSQGKKLDYQTKATAKKEVEKKAKESALVAAEQSSDEEVRERSALKSLRQKDVQAKSESEDDFSSASTSDDQSELHLHESIRMKEYHKVHPKAENKIERERAVKTNKTQGMKQKSCHISDTDMREQSKEGKRSIKVNEKTKKVRKPKCLKANDASPRKEREDRSKKRRSPERKVVEQGTTSPGSSQESEDEESDSDNSSEDEEDRDSSESEQKSSSNEEEETEPDDESSPDNSEEEVKRKPASSYMKVRVTETGGRKGKRVKIAVGSSDLPGHEDQSGPRSRGNNEERDIQPKNRSRRRHRESSMSPTTRVSSSPSTSHEDNQKKEESEKQPNPTRQKETKEQGVKIKQEKVKRKEEEPSVPSSSDTDDSSPDCDMRSLTEEECKKLKKVFKRFFGKLCCAIVNPVETAAQLQEKHLISQSMMKDLIISPESQQSTISVVGLISKKIGAHPDRLFLFIDILLDYDAPQLQRVGKEMLTEAGILTFIQL